MTNGTSFSNAWEVFTLFSIPIGGGIPAGVVLAQKRGLSWQVMTVLYFFSDIALAFVFEPLMLGLAAAAKRVDFLKRFKEAYKKAAKKGADYGVKMGPFALVMVAFGADPMTGRTAALAAGHGFVSGWALAITGDMFFFLLLMASTLWLQGILGDGTATTIIITVAMLVIPAIVRRVRERRRQQRDQRNGRPVVADRNEFIEKESVPAQALGKNINSPTGSLFR